MSWAYQDNILTAFPQRNKRSQIEELGWISKSGLPILILSETLQIPLGPRHPPNFSQIICWRATLFVGIKFVLENPGLVPSGAWRTPTLLQIENVNFLPLSTPSRTTGRRNAKSTWWLMTVGRLYWLYWLGILNGNSWLTGENGDYEDPWIPRVTLQHCHDDPFNWDKGGSGFLIWTHCDDEITRRYTENSLSPRGFNWLLLFKSPQHDLFVYLININTISVVDVFNLMKLGSSARSLFSLQRRWSWKYLLLF